MAIQRSDERSAIEAEPASNVDRARAAGLRAVIEHSRQLMATPTRPEKARKRLRLHANDDLPDTELLVAGGDSGRAAICAQMAAPVRESAQEQARRRFAQMYAAGAFRPVDRFIRDRSNAEDRLQDAICQVYEMDARYAARGTVLAPAILVHACRLRAIEPHRRFVKNDARPARDVLHQPNFTAGKVEVHRLDGLLDPDTGGFRADGDRALQLGLAQYLLEDPTAKFISAIDLLDWLRTLDARDAQMLVLRQMGHTLGEIGSAVGISMSTVFKRLKELGRELASRSDIVVVKKQRKPRSQVMGRPVDEARDQLDS